MRKTLLTIMLALAISVAIPVHLAFAYGGGGTGQDDDAFGGIAVSWTPNPNGVDVIGSSIWSGRPADIERGPYKRCRAVEDAEEMLLTGFQKKSYTADEVIANLEWAERVGIEISDKARNVLNSLKNPPKKTSTPSKSGTSSTSQASKNKQADKIGKVINYIADYNKLRGKHKSQGKKTTQFDIAVIGLKNTIKDNVPNEYKDYVDEVFEFFGY